MTPDELLEQHLIAVAQDLTVPLVADPEMSHRVEAICRCNTNKAPIRFMLACLLAKVVRPEIDVRKPYTEIKGDDSYSGRLFDKTFVQGFVETHKLPCNSTTAFLTPAFRNIDRVLTTDLVLVGKPKEVYVHALELLDSIHQKKVSPEILLKEILRILLIIRSENENRMQQLLTGLKQTDEHSTLFSEQIITLLEQHLNCKNSSRLPVLMVAAAYSAVGQKFGEKPLPLQSHNAADKQTGAIGDVEIILEGENQVVTCCEMKDKRVTINDINLALTKISNVNTQVDNYIFITTEQVEAEVAEYVQSIYETSGVEVAILDCLGFIRHYLHFFRRYRFQFLDVYQNLVLSEPNSSVDQSLKEAFLILRKQAESG